MCLDYRCFYCFTRNFEKLIEDELSDNQQKNEFTNFLFQVTHNYHFNSAPELSALLHRKLRKLGKSSDPYLPKKQFSNKLAEETLQKWIPYFQKSNNKFDFALRLAIAGNIMDYAAGRDFDIAQTIEKVLNCNYAINHSNQLFNDIQKSKQVLYLGDNAGEIVFDKFFIELIDHPNIYFAVRGEPVINDATVEDAYWIKMNNVAKIISNGYDAPSTILKHCSKDFKEVWNNSDLIISKGQGNFEGLIDEKSRKIYFLLMVKCNMIAELLSVNKGDFVLKGNYIEK